VLTSAGQSVGWKLSSGNDSHHLQVRSMRSNVLRIEFQPRAFYEDILSVCDRAGKEGWSGQVMSRYNGWMSIDLDSVKSNASVKAAKLELAGL